MIRLILLLAAAMLAACSLTRPLETYPSASGTSAAPGTVVPEPGAPSGASPSSPTPAAPGGAPAAPHPFRLGTASAALAAQARTQAASGNPELALTTMERALRIEPDNPLLWIELGSLHQEAGRYAQAGNIGHKALQLATGDPNAQAGAWRLIADAARAQGHNQEASDADAHARALAAH